MSSHPVSPAPSRVPLQAFLLDSVDSTNEAAKRYIREGTITTSAYVLAAEQTAGKGNRGRRWLSPEGAGVYMSVVDAAPNAAAPPSALFTLAAGVACAEVLREYGAIDVRLKPINDLYVGQRKLGGILTESLIEGGVARTIITGVGINTLSAPRAVDRESADPISLEELVGAAQVSKMMDDGLVAALVRRVLMWNDICRASDHARVQEAWESLCLPGTVFPSDCSG